MALNFREPAHEWTFLKRGEDGAWDQGGLLQGQGFENIGDQTFVYYGAWDPRQWQKSTAARRSRHCHAAARSLRRSGGGGGGQGPGDYQVPVITCEFVTSRGPAQEGRNSHRFHLNADGLGPEAALRVELLDHLEKPIPGFSGKDAAIVRESGFQTPIMWRGKDEVKGLPERVKLHVVFEGKKRTEIRFSAIYLH